MTGWQKDVKDKIIALINGLLTAYMPGIEEACIKTDEDTLSVSLTVKLQSGGSNYATAKTSIGFSLGKIKDETDKEEIIVGQRSLPFDEAMPAQTPQSNRNAFYADRNVVGQIYVPGEGYVKRNVVGVV